VLPTHLKYIGIAKATNCLNGPLFVAMFLFLLVKPQLGEPIKTFWLYSIFDVSTYFSQKKLYLQCISCYSIVFSPMALKG
jgi:hypothetical protein